MLLHAGVNFALGVLGREALTGSKRLLTILLVLTVVLASFLYGRIRKVKEIPAR